jgi:hypothetical protein
MTTDLLTAELAAYVEAFAPGTAIDGATVVTGTPDSEQDFPLIAIVDAGATEFNPNYGCLRANVEITLTTIPGEAGELTTERPESKLMATDLWNILADKSQCQTFITSRGSLKVFDIPSISFRTEAESERRTLTFDAEYVVCPL